MSRPVVDPASPATPARIPPLVQVIPPNGGFAIAIHGGAGTIPQMDSDSPEARSRHAALARIIGAACERATTGAFALDVAESAVRDLEDEPLFNAGRGAVLTRDGTHELEACLCDGARGESGAVAGVATVRHPISLAREVMRRTEHRLLAFEGAERLADETELERVANEWFTVPLRAESLKRWHAARLRGAAGDEREPLATERNGDEGGTVGCVVRDASGRLAAATSTGGMTGKRVGRVGDTPIVGAGSWADTRVAVSGTGTGERFMDAATAHAIAMLIACAGVPLEHAVREVLGRTMHPGDGGVVAVDADGTIACGLSSSGMYRAVGTASGVCWTAIHAERCDVD